MSTAATPPPDDGLAEDPASPKGCTGCLARMTPVTTPGCASCLTAVFLAVTALAVLVVLALDPDHVPWQSAHLWRRIALVTLVVVIPLVVYKMIQWWLEEERSPFPDVEYAWDAGVEALASNGLSLRSLPLYVVLGSSSERQERGLLDAAGLRLLVAGVPAGNMPLRWYATSDAIYLFCSDSAWTSALASLREELRAEAAAKGMPVESPGADFGASGLPVSSVGGMESSGGGAMRGGGGAAASGGGGASFNPMPSSDSAGGGSRGTLMLDQFLAQMNQPAAGGAAAAPASGPSGGAGEAPGQRGTMMLGGPFYGMPSGGASSSAAPPPAAPARLASSDAAEPGSQGGMEPVLVAPQYSAVCLQQLQFVGRLLRRVRNPVCGLNGVLVLLQYESIFSSPAELDELQKAIHADLATIQYSTQVRCPVTALIVGLERERGFQELVRRVGRERALTQRFGRKFDVRCLPTSEELTALSIHVCGAFEDWAYALFREAEALTRPGNERLYELLSKVRCTWKVRLGDLLAGGFGSEPGDDASTDSLLFSGCYVAATGDTPDRQAFVKGVIDKLHEEQELVEWTDEAIASQRFYERLVTTGSYLAAAGAFGLVGLMTYRWLKK